MCVEEGWYFHRLTSWSVNGHINLSNLWFEYGLSSNQIRTNDIRTVVLLVVDPLSIHHYIFWSDQYYHLVHIIVEFHLYGKLDELLLSPSATFLSPLWFVLNIPLVLETSKSIIFISRSWSICWMKEATFSDSRAFGASCRRELEKVSVASFGIIASQSCMCEVCYGLTGSLPPFYMCFLARQATDWLVQGEGVPS